MILLSFRDAFLLAFPRREVAVLLFEDIALEVLGERRNLTKICLFEGGASVD